MFSSSLKLLEWKFVVPLILLCLYAVVLRPLYNVFLHPLRKYPGPKVWAASTWPWAIMFLSGKSHIILPKLHERYGPVVRLAPNELSFTVPEAWEDIFGRAQPGKRDENQKAPWYLSPSGSGILGAAHTDHARMRRLMSNGFSTGAMIEQQPKILEHVDTLIERLRHKAITSHVPVDLRDWYNYCTFDIIGELALGEPFGCLLESAMHPWISLIFSNVRLTAILLVCKRLPLLFALMPFFISMKLVRQFMEHQKVSKEKLERRLALPDAKPDFVANMLSVRRGQSMSRRELNENAVILTLAGSETTASALCGATYLLMQHPKYIQNLRDELQCSFKSEDEMDLVAVTKLPYLCAVTDEALRIYPPGPNSQPRITPAGGNTVLGQRLPKGVVLGVPHRAMYLSEDNFYRAHEFLPERWLGAAGFENDRKDAFKPFSHGPRNCIGTNLAYAEFRLILARMIWNFDFTLAEQSRNWMEENGSYLIWHKPPLYVHLQPR